MDGVIDLIANCVDTPGGWWDSIVYDNQGQVQVWEESCHLFRVIIKFVAIIDAAFISKYGSNVQNDVIASTLAFSIYSRRANNFVIRLVVIFSNSP